MPTKFKWHQPLMDGTKTRSWELLLESRALEGKRGTQCSLPLERSGTHTAIEAVERFQDREFMVVTKR